MRVRIKFRKYGPVRFIGHLDVMRFFQKAIRRAGIDVAYTTGFSPHQVMSFAAPLGVGLESNGEYMDIEIASKDALASIGDRMSCEEIVRRLNQVSVPGIEVVSAVVLPQKAGNAMASVAAASYTVRFREGRGPGFAMAPAIEDLLAEERILVTKKTKKGQREVDLKPGIYRLEWRENALHIMLDASSAGNIKPSQVVAALFSLRQESLQENVLHITREETYTNLGTPESPRWVPLDAVGEVFS